MRKPVFPVLSLATALMVMTLSGCRDSSPPTTADQLVASLPKSAPHKAAGPFSIDHVPAGHVITAVVHGAAPIIHARDWCIGKVCASAAFNAWRGFVPGSGPWASNPETWPTGSYAIVLDAPAPRVNDDRTNLLPTGSAISVVMLPGSRSDLALGATYNVMDHEGEHGPSRDVWFDRRIVRVGRQQALLTEGYGSDEGFSRDVKTLYFEGPRGELGVVRATSNIFFGADVWDRTEDGNAARTRRSRTEAERQQLSDAELIAVAASVRPATVGEFTAAARRVANGRVCTIDAKHGSCPYNDAGCRLRVGGCFTGQAHWGDWQKSPDHAVYFEFDVSGANRLFALSPEVSSLRVTTLTRAGKERTAPTITTSAPVNGVRWARTLVEPHRVTALDASGRELETVRVDLAGP